MLPMRMVIRSRPGEDKRCRIFFPSWDPFSSLLKANLLKENSAVSEPEKNAESPSKTTRSNESTNDEASKLSLSSSFLNYNLNNSGYAPAFYRTTSPVSILA